MNYLFKKKIIVIDWNFYELHHYLSMNHNKCHILRWYEWDLPVYCNKHLLVGRYWDFTSCQGKNSLSMYIFTDSYHLIMYFNGTCKICIIIEGKLYEWLFSRFFHLFLLLVFRLL